MLPDIFGRGASLALLFGVWDGLDGKLARLNEQTTELGKREHVLDYFIEMSWWTALAYHFQAAGQVRRAYVFLLVFVGADAVERLARRLAALRLGRKLDDASRFDRIDALYRGSPQHLYVVVRLLSSDWNASGRLRFALLLGNCEQRDSPLSSIQIRERRWR